MILDRDLYVLQEIVYFKKLGGGVDIDIITIYGIFPPCSMVIPSMITYTPRT